MYHAHAHKSEYLAIAGEIRPSGLGGTIKSEYSDKIRIYGNPACEFTNEHRLLIPVLWSEKNTEYRYPLIDSLVNSMAFRRYTTCVNDTW